jgi:hypothetical protein
MKKSMNAQPQNIQIGYHQSKIAKQTPSQGGVHGGSRGKSMP